MHGKQRALGQSKCSPKATVYVGILMVVNYVYTRAFWIQNHSQTSTSDSNLDSGPGALKD